MTTIYAIAVGVIAVIVIWWRSLVAAERRAEDRAETKAIRDTLAKTQAGSKAAAKATQSGKTPDQIMRDNDAQW